MNKDNYPDDMPEEFKPIRPWGYVGYFWLFAIPIVGLIFMIIYATDDSNINRRNLARGYLWNMLIGVVISIIISILLISIGLSLFGAASKIAGNSVSDLDSIIKDIESSTGYENSYYSTEDDFNYEI